MNAPAIADMLQTADAVHGAAIRSADWSVWRNLGPYAKQEIFHAEALKAGVPDKTRHMGFVVGKCMSLSGHGGF